MRKLNKLIASVAVSLNVISALADEPDYYLEWIGSQSSPQQEIDTGYAFVSQPRVVATMMKMDAKDCDQMGTKSAWFDINYSSSQLWYRYASTSSSITIGGITPAVNGRWINGDWSDKIIHDGVEIGAVKTAFTGNGQNFFLFRGRSYSYVRFKAVDLYEGEDLVRSFRPAVKDGVVGMWDSVTQKLYVNTGTGVFEQGPRMSDASKLTVVGEPADYGVVTPAYGVTKGLTAGETFVASAPVGTIMQAGLALRCTGWRRYAWNAENGDWDLVGSGADTSFQYVHPDPAKEGKIEWLWELGGVNTPALGPGEIKVELEDGAFVLTAVPSAGARFVGWYGDDFIPVAERMAPVVRIPDDGDIRTVRAHFVSNSGERTSRTWTNAKGSGLWTEAKNWAPEGVPTPDDAVTIGFGRVTIPDFAVAGSLTVESGAELYLGSSFFDGNSIYAQQLDGSAKALGLAVEGDVVCAGAITIGGQVPATGVSTLTNLQIRVGGDLRAVGSARIAVYAASDPAAAVRGDFARLYAGATVVKVGGVLELQDTAVLYPVSDELTGASVKFEAATFRLAERAKVDARNRGWHWFKRGDYKGPSGTYAHTKRNYNTFAMGIGFNSEIGSGYGGPGGGANETFGLAYGFAFAPFLPGAPAGGDSNYSQSYTANTGLMRGGGCFWLRTTGEAVVEGQIDASARNAQWDAASGGGVWLAVGDLTVGPDASITAKGADKGSSGGANCAGGGGRVSLAIGLTDEQLDALARGATPEGVAASETISRIQVNVFGGATSSGRADDGTMTTVVRKNESDVNVTVLSGSAVAVTGTEPQYGTWPMADRTEYVFTAPEYGRHPENDSWRYRCLGYVVSNATEQVAAGSEPAFAFALNGEDITVCWLWGDREFGVEFAKPANGRIRANGTLLDDAGWAWTPEGAQCVLEAVPDAGCEFLNWTGEVADFDDFASVQIVMDSSVQRVVAPLFRVKAEPGDYVWNGGNGDWADATQWTPANVPGPADRVTIGAGTCTVGDYAAAAALTVSGGLLKTVPTAASGRREHVRIAVSGNLAVGGDGAFTFGATGGGNTVWNRLDVGGNLTLDDTAEFLFSAGRRDESHTIKTGSGFVNVGGDFSLRGQSVFRPNCSGQNAGAPVVTVDGRFLVETGAMVDADERGFGTFSHVEPNVGCGDQGNRAAGHGGCGQKCLQDETGEGGVTYDAAYAPVWPGQQNRESGTAPLVRGGGVVRVKARTIRVDGTVSANGGVCVGGSSAGGTIWLLGNLVELGAQAILSATGAYVPGTGIGDDRLDYGASGGGRIAIGIGLDEAKIAALLADGDVLPRRVHDVTAAYLAEHPTVTITAASGVNGVAENVSACQGTVRVVRGNYGFALIVK